MRVILRVTTALTALFAGSAASAAAAPLTAPLTVSLPLLPMPASVVAGEGRFALHGASIVAADAGEKAAAARFTDLLARSGGPKIAAGSAGTIRFLRDPSIDGGEAYRLEVTPAAITIRASGDAGLFYGAETLFQLAASARDGRIAAVTIADKPAFAWRGMMLDSVRHFQPPAYIEQLLDRMASEKLNVFHWHLTDDQGWRVPIDRYPRLIEIGAWRVPAGAEGRDPKTGKPVRYGGFYTKDEIRGIVAYAAARHITIVPEIEMPGHATAMVAAYPELASTPTPPTAPSADWGVLPNLLNPTDTTFTFLDHVLDEVMALFPGQYIHVGGDEPPKDQWKANPQIQAQIKALGLKDEEALQGWFTARIGDYLQKHGRRLIGWDEILAGGVPADATVMSWRGMDGALKAAHLGHDTVLAPAPMLYLDNRQSDSADEPPGRGDIEGWHKLYDFDSAPASLSAEERRHILGLQVNLWTEHLRTTDFVDRMIWPRAAILAELGWSPPVPRDWTGFTHRLRPELARWQALGWGYDRTPLEPEAKLDGGTITLSQPAEMGDLHVTTDGSAPTVRSPLYTAPIAFTGANRIAAQSFLDGAPLGEVRRWRFDAASPFTRAATAMQLCSNKLPVRVQDDGPTDGVHRILWGDMMQTCWIWPKATLDGVRSIGADVGSVPFNFALGADIASVTFRPPATPAGELEIRQDSCDGPRIAVIPLAPATASTGVTSLSAPLAAAVQGTHDLCMTFTQRTPDPLWLLDRLILNR
ncbi:family 20 glycosylhydrolase [Sphingomonas abietis]|uniref:beta-N-acetylhexosaminidase n=1 Tax=Sphingomonas abietis TaxID=3012344 RepID=A0ABY7NKI2_9SPHN|nr:family 20 glycosylhydrolase [Sphingomonas abietis]WBO21858.1 family 20 glycosylhydrolase [Sphingomonas abietis]